MKFRIVGEIRDVQTIAKGSGVTCGKNSTGVTVMETGETSKATLSLNMKTAKPGS